MITYKYKARNPVTGEKIESEVQADNIKNASALIQKLGYAPLEIEEEKPGSARIGLFSRIKSKDRIIFSNQLSTLLNAGIPLVQALRSVQDQTKNKHLQSVTANILLDVESGKTLSSALAKYPDVFNSIYVSLVSAGETSGTLNKSLERLSSQQEKDAEIISKVRGAMVYPIIVIFVMIGVVTFMMVKVVPEVEKIYATFKGVELPLITNLIIGLSRLTIRYWWVIFLILFAGAVFMRRWMKTANGRSTLDKLKIVIPPTNKLMMRLYMARFARTSHTLVGAGVPLLQVLEVTSHSINNVIIENSFKAVIDKVKGGKALSDALNTNPYILELVPKMIKIGEQSGSMEQMLDKTAEYYEKEVDTQISNISTVIEPAMMILLGVMALTIVAAVLLPIYGIAGQSFV